MSSSYSGRTVTEIWAQKCIEDDPQLLSKQIQGNGFTKEESVEIADCALSSRQEAQAKQETAGWIVLGIVGPIVLATIIYGACMYWKVDKECKETEREWQEAHKKCMEELERIYAEGQKAKEKEERKKKRGKK